MQIIYGCTLHYGSQAECEHLEDGPKDQLDPIGKSHTTDGVFRFCTLPSGSICSHKKEFEIKSVESA